MKKLSKRVLSLVLSILILVSLCTVMLTANAADSTVVYYRNSKNFSSVYAYYWPQGGSGPIAWPGTAMTAEGDNIYSVNVPAGNGCIIFSNNGGNQTADLTIPADKNLYDGATGVWEEYNPGPKMPSISASKKDGASFKSETMDVTITVTDAQTASYSIDGGASKNFTGSAIVTMGAGVAVNATTTLTVTATNENGTTTKTFTYTKKEASSVQGDGATSPACGGYYGTNPDGGVGKRKTITVDGDKSDWETSMLIAQGTANDDPRVYRENSMYEVGIDDYAMYAAWDNDNLYLMWEMANVQDVVAPNDDYPISQGNLFQTQNLPIFLYMYTGQGNLTNNRTATGTLWDTGITYDAYVDTVVAFSTNGSNGPFIYTADEEGILNPDVLVNKNTGIKLDWGNGATLSGELWGIDKAYGHYNNRIPGDMFDESSAWVDFYKQGHNPKYDFFYEMSIPLSSLNISASDIENNGIGLLKVITFGTSGMDCLPYDPSMNDNADKAATMSQEFNSMEKEDEDHITVPLARVGKAGSTPPPTPQPSTEESTQPSSTPSVGYVLGDADGDGVVSIIDSTSIQRHSASLETISGTGYIAGDVDKDEFLSVMDSTSNGQEK